MLYSYKQAIELSGSNHLLQKDIELGKLFKIENGIYSTEQYVSELDIISMKYPNAIFTLNSAFYYYELTDVIPDFYYIKTGTKAKKIKDTRIKQFYETSNQLELGSTVFNYNNSKIKIYNKERLLVELIRNKNNLSFDYYKEVLLNYRKIINQLDMQAIQDYAYALPKSKLILETLQLEVLWLQTF